MTAQRPRFPRAAVAAAALIAVAELAFLATSEPMTGVPFLQPTADDATVIAKQRMMPRAGGAIALIGDSSCMMGLIPEAIEAQAGLPCVNLGTLSSLTMAGYAAQTRALLAQPHPPRAIVLAVLPQALEVTEADARRFGLVSRYLVAYPRGDAGLFEPSFAERREWWTRKHQLNRFPPSYGGSFAAYEAGLRHRDGFLPERKRDIGEPPVRETFNPTPFAQRALQQLIADAEAAGVPVLLWWSPKPRHAVTPAYAASAQASVQALQDQHPWLTLLQPEPPVWGVDRFGSENHLTPDAAVANSRQLAAALVRASPEVAALAAADP